MRHLPPKNNNEKYCSTVNTHEKILYMKFKSKYIKNKFDFYFGIVYFLSQSISNFLLVFLSIHVCMSITGFFSYILINLSCIDINKNRIK